MFHSLKCVQREFCGSDICLEGVKNGDTWRNLHLFTVDSEQQIDINGPVQGSNAFRCQWRLCAVVTRMRKETFRNRQIQISSIHLMRLTTQVLFPREADEGRHVQRSTVKALTLTVSGTNCTFHSQHQLLFADQGLILFTWRISSNLEVFLLLGCHGLKI